MATNKKADFIGFFVEFINGFIYDRQLFKLQIATKFYLTFGCISSLQIRGALVAFRLLDAGRGRGRVKQLRNIGQTLNSML